MTSAENVTGGKWHGFVRKLIQQMTDAERAVLQKWAQEILDLRAANLPPREKIRRAVAITKQSKAIVPFLKIVGKEAKRLGWDERGLPARVGLSTVTASLLLFGGAGSGIAAFGGAIGVPLWILFGSGGVFAGAVIEEIRRASKR